MERIFLKTLIVPFVLVTIGVMPALANDTSAVLGVGGLELTKSDDIVMVSEDLYLSPGEVRVKYEFRNESDHDITTTVAFPLPEIDQSGYEIVFLPEPDKENFVGFRVQADGQEIHPKLEQKAIGPDGADVTAVLTQAGLPVNSQLAGWEEKVRALPDQTWRQLVQEGLFDVESDDPNDRSADVSPTWVLRASFHWEQTFPAGKTITVEHRYEPIVGGVSIFAEEGQFEDYKDYCLDEQGKAGVRRLLRQAQAAARRDPQLAAGISPVEVSYVLTTGANWKGPIRNFHLTIDKEQPKSILSLCMSGLKKTGPTTFELDQTDFTPKEDIRFVVFREP